MVFLETAAQLNYCSSRLRATFSNISLECSLLSRHYRKNVPSNISEKKTSREKRRISDGGGGYEKRLNEIPLALGCTAWQSDTPPTSNRVIRRLPGPYPRLTTSCDRLPASLSDLLHELKRKRVRHEREERELKQANFSASLSHVWHKIFPSSLNHICEVFLLNRWYNYQNYWSSVKQWGQNRSSERRLHAIIIITGHVILVYNIYRYY